MASTTGDEMLSPPAEASESFWCDVEWRGMRCGWGRVRPSQEKEGGFSVRGVWRPWGGTYGTPCVCVSALAMD